MRPILPLLMTIPATHGPAGLLQRTSPRTRLILSALGAVLAVALVWRLAGGESSNANMKPPPPVIVAKAEARDVTITEHALGTIVANATVNVTSRVDGQMASAQFKEGQTVHAGDILFELDQRPFRASLEQAQATLARDQAQFVSAQRDAVRYETLAKENAVSAQQRDQAVAQAGAFAGTVKADKAAVDLARLNLQYSVIRSPIDGKTGPILIQPGNLVKANDVNAMVVVTQEQPVKVSFFLPQSDLPKIQEQQKIGKLRAVVQTHDQNAMPASVPVDFIGNAVSQQTGTIELRATIGNEDLRFVPGQLVDVSVALDQISRATVVPHEAVNSGPDGRYVFVVDKDGKADIVPVTVIFESGQTDAIAGKVRPGQRVITEGQLRVIAGHPVAIAKPGKAQQ